jgi:FkbM family methyltransferase
MKLPNLVDRLLVTLDARRIRSRGDPEHHQLSSLVMPGQTALDVGANHGVYSYSLMLCGALVHAIEPNPLLARRLRGARLPRVTVHEAAIGGSEGQAELFVPRHLKGWQNDPAGSLIAGEGDGWRYPVRVITIDGLGLKAVDFMKIDVEGFEGPAIDGAWKTIQRDKPKILIELEDRIAPGCRRTIIGRLGDIGYSAWYFDQGDWRSELDLGADQIAPSGRYINNFLLTRGDGKPASASL